MVCQHDMYQKVRFCINQVSAQPLARTRGEVQGLLIVFQDSESRPAHLRNGNIDLTSRSVIIPNANTTNFRAHHTTTPHLQHHPQHPQSAHTLPSPFPTRFILSYHTLNPAANPATKKLHPAHTKFPVGYPCPFSCALQIHCAMICPTPAQRLCTAIASPSVRKEGLLHVTQLVKLGAQGNAPHAARQRQP